MIPPRSYTRIPVGIRLIGRDHTTPRWRDTRKMPFARSSRRYPVPVMVGIGIGLVLLWRAVG